MALGRARTGLLLAAALALGCMAAEGATVFSFDFENSVAGWSGVSRLAVRRSAAPAGNHGGRFAMEVPLDLPGSSAVALRRRMDWREAGRLQFDLYVPASAEKSVQVLVYVRDWDGLWYQTNEVFRPEPGAWTTIAVDASPDSIGWEMRGHLKPWCGYAVQFLDEVGVKIFGDAKVKGSAYVDNVILTRRPPRPAEELRVLDFSTSGDVTPRYGLFEMTFELNRTYDNPFDPDEADVRGVFVAPSGMVQMVPGFFYQDFARSLEEKCEMLAPLGRPVWKVRYCPQELGRHRYYLEVREKRSKESRRFFDATVDPSRLRTLQCVPSESPGYVRTSTKDWRYFEFDNGEPYYPIGHNIPATYNVKNAQALGLTIHTLEGTFAYDRFLEGMTSGEENYARIWLASWSFGLEWSRAYSWEYRDLGRYSLRNAWRFDYVLDECARRGILVQLALTTFGHYRSQEFEGDWPYSPYNSANGGPINDPTEFWTSEVCQKYYRRMLRYVMARWGYSPNIMAWEVSNEIDLVTGYEQQRQNIMEWHRECIRTLREFDQGHHLVTTNFAVWERDPLILSLPELSYSSTNRYERGIVEALRRIYHVKSSFEKPALMAECGDDFKGSSAATTEAYIPVCLWAAYMMPYAGAGTQWWWDFIDDRNLYFYFKGLSRYARGEDRRGQNLEMQKAVAVRVPEGKPEDRLGVECLGNGRKAYFWIYETMLLRPDMDWSPKPRKDIAVRLVNVKDGPYRVEFWHTITGEILETVEREAKGGVLEAPVPEFVRYIAGKVKPAPGPPAEPKAPETGSGGPPAP